MRMCCNVEVLSIPEWCTAKHVMYLPSVLYSFCRHCLEFLSIDFINLYKSQFIVNIGIAATAAIASYVISVLSIWN